VTTSWAPSRLHVGLLHPGPTRAGRRFGGCGVMLQNPSVQVRVDPARTWSAQGPAAARALEFAMRFVEALPPEAIEPHQITVEALPPEHCGFGSGTQLALAVTHALSVSIGDAEPDVCDLARRVGRGRRSAIGIHGFQHGGFLVDGGKSRDDQIAPMVAHAAVPDRWRWLLLWPVDWTPIHGSREQTTFDQWAPAPQHDRDTDALCRLLLLGMLPALKEADFDAFSDSLYEYSSTAGEMYTALQGGHFSSEFTADMITRLRRFEVKGCLQSSWGPLTAAVVRDEVHAQFVLKQFESSGINVLLTSTWNGSETNKARVE